MKKFFLIIAFLLLFAPFAQAGDGYATGNTVEYTGAYKIVTFNTVINWIYLRNESTARTVHVTLTGLGWNRDKTAYITPSTITQSTVTTIGIFEIPEKTDYYLAESSIYINTDKIGIMSEGGNGYITYFATGDRGQL